MKVIIVNVVLWTVVVVGEVFCESTDVFVVGLSCLGLGMWIGLLVNELTVRKIAKEIKEKQLDNPD